jgi:hypothetical protein
MHGSYGGFQTPPQTGHDAPGAPLTQDLSMRRSRFRPNGVPFDAAEHVDDFQKPRRP